MIMNIFKMIIIFLIVVLLVPIGINISLDEYCKIQVRDNIPEEYYLLEREDGLYIDINTNTIFNKKDISELSKGMPLGLYYNNNVREQDIYNIIYLNDSFESKGRYYYSYDVGLFKTSDGYNISKLKCNGNCNLKFEKDIYEHLYYRKFERKYLKINTCEYYD